KRQPSIALTGLLDAYPMRAPVVIALRSALLAVSIIVLVKPIADAKADDTKRCLVPSLTSHGAPESVALMYVPSRTGTAAPSGRARSATVAVTASFDRYSDARASAEIGRRVLVWITQNDLPS